MYFGVRERTEESLRTYIESGAHLENKAVNQLLEQYRAVGTFAGRSRYQFKNRYRPVSQQRLSKNTITGQFQTQVA